jgi:hypothetical protein
MYDFFGYRYQLLLIGMLIHLFCRSIRQCLTLFSLGTRINDMPAADIVNAQVNDPYGSKLVMRPRKKTMAGMKAGGLQKMAESITFGVIGAGQMGNGIAQAARLVSSYR